MNSINREQPEPNRADVSGPDAVKRIQELVGKAETCFFRTTVGTGDSGGARPMNVRQVDDRGHLWFLSASDSHTNQELALDPRVELYFQASPHSDFLHLQGRALVSTDRARIGELWSPLLKTWFTGGIDDPRITVIEVAPAAGYYWDNRHGDLVAAVKMVIGAAFGKTLDDSIEGKVLPS